MNQNYGGKLMKKKGIARILTTIVIIGSMNTSFAYALENKYTGDSSYAKIGKQKEELTVIKTGTTTMRLNVRKGGSTSYISLGKIEKGTKVEIVEVATTGWYKIKYQDDYGYISHKYVKIDKDTDRVYQNPSQYFQIQDNISFEGQGNYILKKGSMGLKVRKVQQKLGMSKTYKN